jgi:predicted ATPase
LDTVDPASLSNCGIRRLLRLFTCGVEQLIPQYTPDDTRMKQACLWTHQIHDREECPVDLFRHQLFQQYVYHNLAEMERAYLHEAVGSVLEALYGEQTEQVAVQLARHFEQARPWEKAVKYLLQAGNRAARLSANQEAIAHSDQRIDAGRKSARYP